MRRRIAIKLWKRLGFPRCEGLSKANLSGIAGEKKVRRFINLYEVDLAYGGAEEGGWWFETGTPLKSLGPVRPDSMKFKKLMQEAVCFAAEQNEGRPSISSVLSRGQMRIHVEATPAKLYPDRRPYYS